MSFRVARSVIMLLLMSIASGCSNVGVPVEPSVALPAPYAERGIRIVVDGLWRDQFGNVLGISGTATNESSRNLKTCMITFDILDASGAKVSSAVASTIGLNAGQTWRFQATFMNPFSVQFKTIVPGQLIAM